MASRADTDGLSSSRMGTVSRQNSASGATRRRRKPPGTPKAARKGPAPRPARGQSSRLDRLWVSLAGITVVLLVSAIALAIALNGVALTAPPGMRTRLIHYLFRNSAATSATGSGRADCDSLGPGSLAHRSHRHDRTDLAADPSPLYPELVQRGFPGISRAELFALSARAVASLGGWRVVRTDPDAAILECTYTTRIFDFVDDIKIEVMPDNEIGLCSRSRRWLGDLGANIGHIQDFYAALTPLLEQAYQQHARQARHYPGNGWR